MKKSKLIWTCWIGSLVPLLPAASTEITLVNTQEEAIVSTVVSIPKETVYAALDLKQECPVQIKIDTGEVLDCGLDAKAEQINVWTSMDSMESIRATIQPAESWSEPLDLVFARSDSVQKTAIASNGLLTAVFKDELFSIYLGSFKNLEAASEKDCVFQHFSLHKSIHHDPSDVTPYQVEFSTEGWRRVFRFDAPVVDVNASITSDGAVKIVVTHEFIHEEAKPIEYKEVLTLMPYQSIIDYRSVFKNTGTETCYFGSRVNQFSAFIKGKYDVPMQVVRANGRLVNEGRLGWFKPRWFSAVTKSGYSLAFTALKPNIPGEYYFDFHRAQIRMQNSNRVVKFGQVGVHHGAADAEKWVVFNPGETEEIGVGVHVFTPGQEVRNTMAENWSRLAKGDKQMEIPSPLAVYLDGDAIQGGSVSSAKDAFDDSDHWQVLGAEIEGLETETRIECDNGNGILKRAICANLDKPFVVQTSLCSLTEGSKFAINVREMGSQEVYPLAEMHEPGSIDILLQDFVPWKGSTSFILGVEVTGETDAGNVVLQHTHIGESVPVAPKLISPMDGMSLTDIAAFFQWREVSGCGEYELELSHTPDFKSPIKETVIMTNPKPYYFPDEIPTAGSYYWRVRALQYDRYSTPGQWSEIRQFELNDDHTASSPVVDIGADSPLITMRVQNWTDRKGVWNQMDDRIKPHFAFRAYSTEGDFYKNLEVFDETNMPVFFEAIVPYSVLGQTCSLADMEYAYQHYPNVIGACLGENFYTYFVDDIAQEYQKRHHMLAAKYGRIFHWSDLHKIGWNELAKRPEYLSGDMNEVVVPLLKTTEPYTAYITQGHVAGWWLAGLAKNTGTQADIWYWASVGFRQCGENGFGVRQGYHPLMPPAVYIQHWLLAMMQGGAVYSNECNRIANHGVPNETWTRYYEPFFNAVIDHQMIPTREEFIAATKVVVHGKLPDDFPDVERFGFSDPNYGPFETLYRELYGAKDAIKDFIPKTGRYGSIVVLPESVTDFEHEGIQIVSLDDLQTSEQVHAAFDPHYPDTYEGDALVLQVGDSLVIMNSNENLDDDQDYSVPFEGDGLVERIQGEVCVHKYMMGKHENDREQFWLQANVSIVSPDETVVHEDGWIEEGTYETRDTRILFTCRERPALSFEPANADVEQTWDPEKHLLEVVLSHDNGAVSLTLESPTKSSVDRIQK